MKKKSCSILFLVLVTLILSATPNMVFANSVRNIKVWIDDFYVMSDVHPFVESDRTYVPIKFIAEELGYSVHWDASVKQVSITQAEKSVTLTIDSKTAYMNDGSEVILDTPARLKQSRTFVPLGAVAELFGETVEYDSTTRVAMIGDDFNPDEYYPLKYYLKSDVFITNSKVNFVKYVVRYSDGRIYNLESDGEILKLIDEDALIYEPLGFVSKVEEEKQLFDKFYIAPIKEDEFVGSWHGITKIVDTTEYYDLYVYVEKIRENEYLFKRRSIKPNGSELRTECYAFYDPETKIMRTDASHITTYATGDFDFDWHTTAETYLLKEFDYFENLDDSKMYMQKY